MTGCRILTASCTVSSLPAKTGEKQMWSYKTKTSFKIGGSVGIIILLLGIAIMFGIYQMSKISQEIIAISEEYGPLSEIVTDIQLHQQNQAVNLEKILRFRQQGDDVSMDSAKENFWFSGGSIDSDIIRGKQIAQTGVEMALSEKTLSEFQRIIQKLSAFNRNHNEYETDARDLFSISPTNQKGRDLLIQRIDQNQIQLENDLDGLLSDLAILTDESANRIVINESDSLTGQIIIITIVGALAAILGLFIDQINKDLKKEVDAKTLELTNANRKLQKLDKMKDEFINIASHELKSPIQPIFGFAELAKSGDIDQKEAWDGVTDLAKTLQDLANNVLDISKIETRNLKLHREEIPINDLIFEVIRAQKINLKDDIRIQENLDENITVRVDRVRIEQVLRNLLSNAIKFTPKGVITISTQIDKEQNELRVRISDSGLGIPQDVLPKLFEKYVTSGTTSQAHQSGSGLGLYLCKGIVNAHGGEITAKNNTIGATIEFTIPIVRDNGYHDNNTNNNNKKAPHPIITKAVK